MIANQCFTKEWVVRKRGEMGGVDPALLEKSKKIGPLLIFEK